MNKTFSFNRFSKFFMFDLKNAVTRFGLSALVTCLIPVCVLFIYEAFCLLLSGRLIADPSGMGPAKVITAFIVAAVVVVIAPKKLYGSITDKRFGSAYILTPASTFEKWLSMMLIILIVLPLCTGASYLLVDYLTSLILPSVFGQSIISLISDFNEAQPEYLGFDFNIVFSVFLSLIQYVLFFTLGALIFKRGKAAKTFIAIFVLSIVLSNIYVLILRATGFDINAFMENLEYNLENDATNYISKLLNWNYVMNIAGDIILMVAIYFRLRTIKE